MPLVLDGTNGVSGVDGTASNPAIEGTDSNTGIFYPAADTVAIGTGGTEALRVTSAQNVRKIYGTEIQSLTSGGSTSHMLSYQTWNGAANLLVLGNTFDGVVFATGGGIMTEKMRLDMSGNLGIGTTTPGVRLDVGGSSTALLSNQTSAYAPSANSTANSFKLFNDSQTTGAYASLEFWARNANNNINIAYIASPSSSSNDVGTLVFGRRTGSNTSAESARITSAGRVGIGQQNPATLLDVAGSITYAIASSTASGLNPVNTYTYNNNTANTIGPVNYGFLLIGISQGNGPTYIPVFLNAGGGIAWSFNAFDPDAGTFVNGAGPTINFATAGTSANSYQIVFSGGNGTATIQRTAGSTAYTVSTFAVAN